ncbi:MAG: hypothetical protein VX737_03635 [Pseudomonadota bacterium]|nr:hypothetical protein [Pseudomonadota bacterium]
MNDTILRQRLLAGIMYYQSHKQNENQKISNQREQDIMKLTSIVCQISDATVLEREMIDYLSKMPVKKTWTQYLFIKQGESHLKEILMSIIRDENRKYNLSVMMTLSQEKTCPNIPNESEEAENPKTLLLLN